MPTNESKERRGRETRLLVLVVVLSIAVLLVMARFRFPTADTTVAPPAPSPLEDLAGRAAFDGLAQSMSTLLGRVSPRVVVVELGLPLEPELPGDESETQGAAPAEPPEPEPEADADATDPPAEPLRLAIALRVPPDLALLHVPEGLAPLATFGSSAPLEVVATDLAREVTLVRLPVASAAWVGLSTDTFTGLHYFGVVEPTSIGPTIQPHFIGRVGLVTDEQWPEGVYPVGDEAGLPHGGLVFSIEERFVGLTARTAAGAVLVPAPTLGALVADLLTAAETAETAETVGTDEPAETAETAP